jgi:hypothetical protein
MKCTSLIGSVFTACLSLGVLMASAAFADTISSPPVYGGPSQSVVVVYVRNVTAYPVWVDPLIIYSENGGTNPVTGNCPIPLASAGTCYFQAIISEVDPIFGTGGLVGSWAVPLLNGAAHDEEDET